MFVGGVEIQMRLSGSVAAAELAIEGFGRNVGGYRVEILSADHQNKPDIGSAIARQWIDRDGVDVIVDVITSSVALAVQHIAKEKSEIVIFSGARAEQLNGSMPSMIQAGTYSAVRHYLRAVQKAGTKNTSKVIATMHALPVEDATVSAGAHKHRAAGPDR